MTTTSPGKFPAFLDKLVENPRVTVRRGGMPTKDGRRIVYWMQRL